MNFDTKHYKKLFKNVGGNFNSEWISKMKGVKNVFKTVEKEHDEIKKSIMDKLKDNGF
jgi:hypothetical protein